MNYLKTKTKKSPPPFKAGVILLLFSLCLVFTALAQDVSTPYILSDQDVSISNGEISELKDGVDLNGKDVIIPKAIGDQQIKSIGGKNSSELGVFENKGIRSLSFDNDSELTEIGNDAFHYSDYLTNTHKMEQLTLPSTTTSIGSNAFSGNSLSEVVIPSGVQIIRFDSFEGNKLTSVIFDNPPSFLKVEEFAFANNVLSEINLPSVPNIEIHRYAFYNNKLKFFDFSNLSKIEENAFRQNELTSVVLPMTFSTFSENVFAENKISSIKFFDGVSVSSIIPEDVKFESYSFAKNNLTQITLPENLVTLEKGVFLENEISSITFNSKLETINDSAFYGNQLVNITLPTSLTTIGEFAFYGNQLVSVTIPNESNLTKIEANAFGNNPYLISISLPVPIETGMRYYWTTGGNAVSNVIYDFSVSYELKNIEQVTVTLEIVVEESGQEAEAEVGLVSGRPSGSYEIDKGISIEIEANPNQGYAVSSWKLDNQEVSTTTTYSLTSTQTDADISLTVSFIKVHIDDEVVLTVESMAGAGTVELVVADGTVDLNEGEHRFQRNHQVSLEAVASEGYRFEKWIIDGNDHGTDMQSNITLDADKTVTASFVEQILLTTFIRGEGIVNSNGDFRQDSYHNVGDKVALTAEAIDGWRFNKWIIDGDLDGAMTSNPINIDIDKEKAVVAYFVEQVKLITSTNGGGSISAVPMPNVDNNYDMGTEVTLTAEAIDGYRFDKWDIDGNVSDGMPYNSINIILNDDTNVEAFFVEQVKLTLTIEGYGRVGGLNSGENWIDKGQGLDLEAHPNHGYTVSSWKLADQEVSTTTTYSLISTQTDADISLTVSFGETSLVDPVTLTIEPVVGYGTVYPMEGDNRFERNHQVNLEAVAFEGWRFEKWVINEGVIEYPIISVLLDEDKVAKASFIEQVKLTLTITGFGMVSGLNSGEYWIDKGQALDLVAQPNEGYKFASWELADADITSIESSSLSSTQTNMDVRLIVIFEEIPLVDPVKLTIEPVVGYGTIDLNEGEHRFQRNHQVSLEAVASEGYRFEKWVIDGNVSDGKADNPNAIEITMDSDKTVQAYFIKQVKLTTIVSSNGKINVDPSSDDNYYDIVTEVTLTAEASEGYRFDKWVITDSHSQYEFDKEDNPVEITLYDDTNVEAFFVEQVKLTLTIEGFGVVKDSDFDENLNSGENWIDKGEVLNLEANPNQGYAVSSWKLDNQEVSTTTTYSLTSTQTDADISLTVSFGEVHIDDEVKLTVESMAGAGTVQLVDADGTAEDLNEGEHRFERSTTVSLVVEASEGYRFEKWVIDGNVSDGKADNPNAIEITMDSDKTTVQADFIKQVKLTTMVSGEGEINVDPSSDDNYYDMGAEVTLTAEASDGYRFEKWVINGNTIEDRTTSTKVTLDEDTEAEAYFGEFSKVELTVKQVVGEGTVDPNQGIISYNLGETVSMTAVASDGWRFDKWVIDDNEATAITNNRFDIKMDGNKTVQAHFIKQVKLATTIGSGEGKINVDPSSDDNYYDMGTEVTLTVEATEGWSFVKWIFGGKESIENEITLILNSDTVVNAYFEGEDEITALSQDSKQIVSFYPNPMTSEVELVAKKGDRIQLLSQNSVYVYDAVHEGGANHSIDVSMIPSGVYFLRLTNSSGHTLTFRVVKR